MSRDTVIYVNTLLPFGAALFGALTKRRVIYHLHEVSVGGPFLTYLLKRLVRATASQVIYVSESHQRSMKLQGISSTVVHNALDRTFLDEAQRAVTWKRASSKKFRVLMLCAIRAYKGVPEFLELAVRFENHPDFEFHLVASDGVDAALSFFSYTRRPKNLFVHQKTSTPTLHYKTASVIVNLSRPDLCEETFGLTLLEGMAFGIPVIGPPVGGPAEIVEHGREGFLVDSRHCDALVEFITLLSTDHDLYFRMARAARARALQFSVDVFTERLLRLIVTHQGA